MAGGKTFEDDLVFVFCSNIELPFTWRILRPNFLSPSEILYGELTTKSEKVDFYPDDTACFTVNPSYGVLEPNEKRAFDVVFSPYEVQYIANNV